MFFFICSCFGLVPLERKIQFLFSYSSYLCLWLGTFKWIQKPLSLSFSQAHIFLLLFLVESWSAQDSIFFQCQTQWKGNDLFQKFSANVSSWCSCLPAVTEQSIWTIMQSNKLSVFQGTFLAPSMGWQMCLNHCK